MRIKTFTAQTMTEAMGQVRDELGPDAIIVSTFEGRRGRGVEVKAAIETAPQAPRPLTDDDLESRLRLSLQNTPSNAPPKKEPVPTGGLRKTDMERLVQALRYHSVPNTLTRDLVTTVNRLTPAEPETSLNTAFGRALDARMTFNMIPAIPARPIMLVGPPGAGKTATAAKLAAQTLLSGGKTALVTTDTLKAGAQDQIKSFARLLDQEAVSADTPGELSHFIQDRQDRKPVIDTPATNPFNRGEMRDLAAFCDRSLCEPVLVLSAGGDPAEMTDMARVFKGLGVRRIIVTRIDVSRRLGGTLWTYDAAGLEIAQISATPYIADGLTPVTPLILATLLIESFDRKKRQRSEECTQP